MTAVYMTHPEHGATHVYSNVEVESHKKNGWVVSEYPKKVFQKVSLEIENNVLVINKDKATEKTLYEQYEEKFGKKPHHRASEKTIQDALKE